MADRQQADEIQVNFEIFKIGGIGDLLLCLSKVQHHYNLTNAFQPLFSGKAAYWKVDFFKAQNFPGAIRFPTNPY